MRIVYPTGSPLVQVLYTHDDLGRVVGIGSTAETPTDFAAYTYTITSEIEIESRTRGTLTGTFRDTSPDWLEAYAATVSGAGSACLALGYAYNGDASVAQRTLTTAFSGPPPRRSRPATATTRAGT